MRQFASMLSERRCPERDGAAPDAPEASRSGDALLHRRTLLAAALLGLALPAPSGWAAGETAVDLRDLYEKDMSFTALARQLEGERVRVSGYMAPPLKADARFFVLTMRPMTVCPFCDSEADWSEDILAVYTKRVLEVAPFYVQIEARGRLELGKFRDRATQFVSRVRLADAHYG